MDPSRGKRKSRTSSLRGKSGRSNQKQDPATQALKEKPSATETENTVVVSGMLPAKHDLTFL
jgi:hypothetical protein